MSAIFVITRLPRIDLSAFVGKLIEEQDGDVLRERPVSPRRFGMMRRSMVLICALALAFTATALHNSPQTSPGLSPTPDIERLEREWNEAHLRGDADALDRLWAEDFTVTVPGMPVMTKADVLRVWRAGRATMTRYDTTGVEIRAYGDAAVVTGRLKRVRDFNGRAAEDDWRFTKVYVKTANQWRVVAYHASVSPSQ